MNTTSNLNSQFFDSSKQPKTEARFSPKIVKDLTSYSVNERISIALRTARLNWIQAKAIIKLSNQGQVSKSQAFANMNKARREYKLAVRLAEAFLADSFENE